MRNMPHKRKNSKNIRKKRMFNRILTVLLFLFLLIFVFSSTMAVKEWLQGKREQEAFEKLSSTISNINYDENKTSGVLYEADEKYTAYAELYEKNNDFAAWITIPNTKIDYPVMLTQNEPEYYLYRSFDKTESSSGTPFIGEGADINSDVFIIYGHNMKNDTMFGTLDFYAKEDFFHKTPAFTLNTVNEKRKYEVFAAVETRVLYQNEDGFRYYEQSGELSEKEFADLVGWLSENSLYDTEITPLYGEQILILSTCSYNTQNGRFIVAARSVE